MAAVGIAVTVGVDVGFVVYLRVGLGVAPIGLAEGAELGLEEGAFDEKDGAADRDGELDGLFDDVGENDLEGEEDGDGEFDGLANIRPSSASSGTMSAPILDRIAVRTNKVERNVYLRLRMVRVTVVTVD